VIAAAPARPEVLQELGVIDGVATRRKLVNAVDEDLRVEADDYAGVSAEDLGFSPKATFALIYGSGAIQSGRGLDLAHGPAGLRVGDRDRRDRARRRRPTT
jgi:hypothetical protein